MFWDVWVGFSCRSSERKFVGSCFDLLCFLPKMKLGSVIFGADGKEIPSGSLNPLCKLWGIPSCFWCHNREKCSLRKLVTPKSTSVVNIKIHENFQLLFRRIQGQGRRLWDNLKCLWRSPPEGFISRRSKLALILLSWRRAPHPHICKNSGNHVLESIFHPECWDFLGFDGILAGGEQHLGSLSCSRTGGWIQVGSPWDAVPPRQCLSLHLLTEEKAQIWL